jgi:hypothetical protein
LGNALAQSRITFGVMQTHDPFFIAPPITEIPDYVWSRQYDKPCFIPSSPIQKPKEEGKRISHPDAEGAAPVLCLMHKKGPAGNPVCALPPKIEHLIAIEN